MSWGLYAHLSRKETNETLITPAAQLHKSEVKKDAAKYRAIVEETRRRLGLAPLMLLFMLAGHDTPALAQPFGGGAYYAITSDMQNQNDRSSHKSKAHEDWTDEEIVNAIYLAEGGAKAQYPYGIRSVNCDSVGECRKICKNTVRNTRSRFIRDQERGRETGSYLTYLARRYCPTAGNLTRAERVVNQYWLKNVTYFLNKNRRRG